MVDAPSSMPGFPFKFFMLSTAADVIAGSMIVLKLAGLQNSCTASGVGDAWQVGVRGCLEISPNLVDPFTLADIA